MKKDNPKYCQKCGFRVRSKDHEKGEHHNKGKDGTFTPTKN